MSWLVTLQLASTLPLAGLIWTIAVVTYPQFARIPKEGFCDYHQDYTARITFVVLPLMVTELAASIVMLWSLQSATALLALGAVIAVWLVTFTMSVPAHNRLATGFDVQAHRKLLTSNWLRTGIWTARAAWLIALVHDR
jgi:hypothetical protein